MLHTCLCRILALVFLFTVLFLLREIEEVLCKLALLCLLRSSRPARGSMFLSPGCAVIPPIRTYCRCCEAGWNLSMSLLLLRDHRFFSLELSYHLGNCGGPPSHFLPVLPPVHAHWHPPVKKGTGVSCWQMAVACLNVSKELCRITL